MGKSKNKYTSSLPEQVLEEVSQYSEAAVELYGIISLAKLTEIINSQNEYEVTPDDIEFVCKENEGYLYSYVYEDNVVHESFQLYEEDDAYETLLDKQFNKPYKIFDKEEFLAYGDDDNVDVPEIFKKLRKYLVAEVEIMRDMAEEICEDMFIGINFEDGTNDLMSELTRREIYVTLEQRKRIFEIYKECRHKSPLWENRGYSNEELEQMEIM